MAALLLAVPLPTRAAPPVEKLPVGQAPSTIHLFAGGVGDGGPSTLARLHIPGNLFVEPMSGNLYIADSGNDRIRRIDAQGTITTVAGNGIEGPSLENQLATRSRLNNPLAVAADSSGNVYIADTSNNKVLKVDRSGILTTVAGTGTRGFSGDGGNAQRAMLSKPYGVTVDSTGSVIIADSGNNRVRKVTGGVITTIAGTGSPGFGGDGSSARTARLSFPVSVTVDRDDNLFVADLANHRVRKIARLTNTITTIAGSGARGFAGDSGLGSRAKLFYPTAVSADRFGAVFIADYGNNRIRVVASNGVISTIAGTGAAAFSGDGGDARRAALFGPWGVAVRDGTLFFSDTVNNRVRQVGETHKISTIAGTSADGYSGDGGTALNARLFFPAQLAAARDGSVLIADSGDNRIRAVSPGGVVSTLAGLKARVSKGDGGPAIRAHLSGPAGVAVDPAGYVYIAEPSTHRIRRIDKRGIITTIAGTGVPGSTGDSGPARLARLFMPMAVASDPAGNIYVADMGNSRIRRIDRRGYITNFAGTGVRGPDGNDVPATRAQLNLPFGVAAGADGSIYIADTGNSRIKKVTPDGRLHVVAGNGQRGFSGDEGSALLATLNAPRAVAAASDGTFYIADTLNQRVRKVTPEGTISTVAGEGLRDITPQQGVPARVSVLSNPAGICVMPDGRVLVADTIANRVLMIIPPILP